MSPGLTLTRTRCLVSPLLRSQLANKMPIMDFGYIDEIMTRHQSVLAEKWHTVADPVSAFMDSANSLWKTSVCCASATRCVTWLRARCVSQPCTDGSHVR